jgi:hypothetical protein
MCGGGPVERKTQTPQHICTRAMERTIKLNYFLLLKDIYKTCVLGASACCIRTERQMNGVGTDTCNKALLKEMHDLQEEDY